MVYLTAHIATEKLQQTVTIIKWPVAVADDEEHAEIENLKGTSTSWSKQDESGTPNENIVQNQLNIALLNVF